MVKNNSCSVRFESVNIDSVFNVLDALSWLNQPDIKEVSQFAGVDHRTAGKVVKNCIQIGIIHEITPSIYTLTIPYPFKGSKEQKEAVLKEAIFKMPLMINLRQFLKLGDSLENGIRKAATIQKIKNYEKLALDPLLKWAHKLDALSLTLNFEDFVEDGIKIKENRHEHSEGAVVFISHSSKDKPIIRQIAADLIKNNISVWVDEQQIKVGDSINDKISQGLAESDYFLLALSESSVDSEWVKKELNSAMVAEIESQKVKILPILLNDCKIPILIKDKKYADFRKSYKDGIENLLQSVK